MKHSTLRMFVSSCLILKSICREDEGLAFHVSLLILKMIWSQQLSS